MRRHQFPDCLFFEFRAVAGHFFTPIAPSNTNEKRADIYCDRGGLQSSEICPNLTLALLLTTRLVSPARIALLPHAATTTHCMSINCSGSMIKRVIAGFWNGRVGFRLMKSTATNTAPRGP